MTIEDRLISYLLGHRSILGMPRELTAEQLSALVDQFNTMARVEFGPDASKAYREISLSAEYLNEAVLILLEEMDKIFRPSIDTTIALIQNQVDQCTRDGLKVTSLYLCGGLGDFGFVYERVVELATRLNIQILQPEERGMAVVLGASYTQLRRLRGDRDIIRAYRRPNYGVLRNIPWDPLVHKEGIDTWHLDSWKGQRIAQNQNLWLTRKGDKIFHDQLPWVFQTFERTFSQNPQSWSEVFVMSTLDDPGTRLDTDVSKIYTVTVDMTREDLSNFEKFRYYASKQWYNQWRRSTGYRCRYKIGVKFTTTRLEFTLVYNGQERLDLLTVEWNEP